VDIGFTKTTVACVDEGAIIRGTSFSFNFGGFHMSRLLLYLLKNGEHYFPYPECSLDKLQDWRVVKRIKEQYCHAKKVRGVFVLY